MRGSADTEIAARIPGNVYGAAPGRPGEPASSEKGPPNSDNLAVLPTQISLSLMTRHRDITPSGSTVLPQGAQPIRPREPRQEVTKEAKRQAKKQSKKPEISWKVSGLQTHFPI